MNGIRKKKSDLKNEIDNLKKVNDKRVNEIEKLVQSRKLEMTKDLVNNEVKN